jgi:hypothetical protein
MLGFVVVVAVSIFLLVGTPSSTETIVVVKIVVVKIVVVFTTVTILRVVLTVGIVFGWL